MKRALLLLFAGSVGLFGQGLYQIATLDDGYESKPLRFTAGAGYSFDSNVPFSLVAPKRTAVVQGLGNPSEYGLLQYTEDLIHPNWETISGPVPWGSAQLSVMLPLGSKQGFYRTIAAELGAHFTGTAPSSFADTTWTLIQDSGDGDRVFEGYRFLDDENLELIIEENADGTIDPVYHTLSAHYEVAFSGSSVAVIDLEVPYFLSKRVFLYFGQGGNARQLETRCFAFSGDRESELDEGGQGLPPRRFTAGEIPEVSGVSPTTVVGRTLSLTFEEFHIQGENQLNVYTLVLGVGGAGSLSEGQDAGAVRAFQWEYHKTGANTGVLHILNTDGSKESLFLVFGESEAGNRLFYVPEIALEESGGGSFVGSGQTHRFEE